MISLDSHTYIHDTADAHHSCSQATHNGIWGSMLLNTHTHGDFATDVRHCFSLLGLYFTDTLLERKTLKVLKFLLGGVVLTIGHLVGIVVVSLWRDGNVVPQVVKPRVCQLQTRRAVIIF